MSDSRERINIVIVGHVDHGKSTVIGRLLADTGSLPKGKLEQVKASCKKNAKPFEYAFLLDALKDEQSQGITIDTARCFFKTPKRDYIILDAPGHIEFLKNMITGAAHAQAALLVIDAQEGVQENSKRHGYMLSLLGIKQVAVLVNKMDLVGYNEQIFNKIKNEYLDFLRQIKVTPLNFIPISAREGENLTGLSAKMPWYQKETVLRQMDAFAKKAELEKLALRFPVQDIYKFTLQNDDRRIIAGTLESGQVSVGDAVVFYPSGKSTTIRSVEAFNSPRQEKAMAGEAAGFTMASQIYIKPGEMMAKESEPQPKVSNKFRANIFWMGKAPLIKNKNYKLKLAAARTQVKLLEIVNVLDASDLTTDAHKQQVDRLDVAETIFETAKPLAFDLVCELENTARFVLVDNYEIVGGGIILQELAAEDTYLKKHVQEREQLWERGSVTASQRAAIYRHNGKFVVLCGEKDSTQADLAKALEKELFIAGYKAFYLGISNLAKGLEADIAVNNDPDEQIRRLGELARIITESGQIFITTISDPDDSDLQKLKILNDPHEILVINTGASQLMKYPVDLQVDLAKPNEENVKNIIDFLKEQEVIIDYYI